MNDVPTEITSEEIQARPRKTGHGWFDIVLALSAVFLSLISLFVAFTNSRAQQQMVAASSWPFVTASASIHENGQATLTLSNDGVGPAKIAYVQLFYQGKPIASIRDLIARCCQREGESKISGTLQMDVSTVNDVVLRPGDRLKVINLTETPDIPALRTRLPAALGELTFNACYCSIFDECWIGDLSSLRPQKVDSCPANAHPFVPVDVARPKS